MYGVWAEEAGAMLREAFPLQYERRGECLVQTIVEEIDRLRG